MLIEATSSKKRKTVFFQFRDSSAQLIFAHNFSLPDTWVHANLTRCTDATMTLAVLVSLRESPKSRSNPSICLQVVAVRDL